MSIEIKRTWMVHEGNTKYYQIFEFTPTGVDSYGHPCTVIHYGPRNSRATPQRPVNGGQVVVYGGASASAKKKAKQSRGYSEVGSTAATHCERDGVWMVETFGAEVAKKINNQIFCGDEILPTGRADNEVKGAEADPEPRPAAWGSW